jgi:cyclopropane fatty-acyl-phospholipid synthase-like methyltransferase
MLSRTTGASRVGNEKIRPYYDKMAANIQTAVETRNKAPDFTRYDVAYMQQYLNAEASLLDLGAGSGLLLNNISGGFGRVVAVELYPAFSKFIEQHPNVAVINADLLQFETDEQFDHVIAFGVMNFFDRAEAERVYNKIYRFTAPGGRMVVKHQMGVNGDVLVDRFSEELGQNYYSEYRSIENEKALILGQGFENIHVTDIYPDEFNRWSNTRFIAITATKPQ